MINQKFMKYGLALSLATAAIVAVAPSSEASFSDVNAGTEAGKAIQKLVDLKIVSGYSDGTFRPNNHVTRAEAAKILALTDPTFVGSSEKTTAFNDVPVSHWSNIYIKYAYDKKLINGYGTGKFGPSDTLTRGQFAKILASILPDNYEEKTISFVDVKESDYFYEGVKKLVSLGVTSGTSSTEFSPSSPISRAQIAVMLERAKLLQQLEEQVKDIESLSVPTSTYGKEMFERVEQQMKKNGYSFKAINKYHAPNLSGEVLPYHYQYPGTFAYQINNKNGQNTNYMLLTVSPELAISHFKMFTREQFVEFVKSTQPAQQLKEMIDPLKIHENYEEPIVTVTAKHSDSSSSPTVHHLGDNLFYVEAYEEGQDNLSVFTYYESIFKSIKVEKSNDIYSYEILEDIPILDVIPLPDSYYRPNHKFLYNNEPASVSTFYDPDELTFTVYDMEYPHLEPVRTGVELQLGYDVNGEPKILNFVYDGQRFVEKK